MDTLRVMSYNIRHGEGMDGCLDLFRIAGVITAAAPDVLALQEVDRGTARAGRVDQAAELARLTGMTVHYGKTLDMPGGGEYGIAVLSRLPVRETVVHPLPTTPGHEPRVALAVRLALGDGEVTFIGTHLDFVGAAAASDRPAQVAELNRLAPVVPAVLAGDLNAVPGDAAIAALGERWVDCAPAEAEPTFPANAPEDRIDYIRCTPADRWEVVSATAVIPEVVASDHRPIVATLRRRPAR